MFDRVRGFGQPLGRRKSGNSFLMAPIKLSPSDFAFLWEECKRCFWRKAVLQESRPFSPMPKIFTAIDLQMKALFAHRDVRDIVPSAPSMRIHAQDGWVESNPVATGRHERTCFVRGIYDCVVATESGYGIVDYKTSHVRSEHVPLYQRQLGAYAYALEHPAPRAAALSPIVTVGLIVYEPHRMEPTSQGASLGGALEWVPMRYDEGEFLAFLTRVLDVVSGPEPASAPGCAYCAYRGRDPEPASGS